MLNHKEDSTFVAGAFLVILGFALQSEFMFAFGAILLAFATVAQFN